MGHTARHYLIFETASGFCAIAWSASGVTRFQLPTKSAEATERLLVRRAPGAELGAHGRPRSPVCEFVSEYRHYPGSNGPGSEKPSIDSTFA